ncbi:MAG: flagellar FlbD family protein [Bacillota bacterium]
MIEVTKMSGDKIIINAELIESIQATPDTVITLTTNKKILVENEVDEIINKVIAYKKEIASCLNVKEG